MPSSYRRSCPALVVTTTSDEVNNTDFVTSLREAINFANSQAGTDTITFDSTVFSGGLNSLIRLGGMELPITESLTIDASNATDVVITADATENDRLVTGTFITDVAASLNNSASSLNDNSRVLNFTAGSGDLTLQGLTITGGRTTVDFDGGGGIRFNSSGTLTLNQSSVSGNRTSGDFAIGGGILAPSGAVMLTGSTVSGNFSVDVGGGGGGGGIYSVSGTVSLRNSTVSGNSTTGNQVSGGGVFSARGAVTLTGSTVTGNSSGDRGGGVFVPNTPSNPLLTVQNSIVAGNTAAGVGPDLVPDPGSTLDVDFSLIGDTTGSGITAATGTGNVLDTNPLLGPLADNGGPTFTHALLAGSPALDAGNSTLVTDQRGLTRPVDLTATANAAGGDGSDIGAFEVQKEAPSLVVTTAMDVVNETDFVTSLREAINFANSQAGADTITFDSTVFAGGDKSLIRLNGSELRVTESLTIDGSSATNVVISGDAEGNDTPVTGTFITDVAASDAAGRLNDNSRVLHFTAGSGDLTLQSLTITGGRTTVSFWRRRRRPIWKHRQTHDREEQRQWERCFERVRLRWRNLLVLRDDDAHPKHCQRKQQQQQRRRNLHFHRCGNAHRQHCQWKQ